MVVNQLQDLSEHLGAASCHAVYQLTITLQALMYSFDVALMYSFDVEGCWGVICDTLTIRLQHFSMWNDCVLHVIVGTEMKVAWAVVETDSDAIASLCLGMRV